MSDPSDYALDAAQDQAERGDCVQRTKCLSCGVEWDAPARDAEGGAPDERLAVPITSTCPACTELGCEPPLSPCCDASLRGSAGGDGSSFFRCEHCDGPFELDTLRTLLLGQRVERVLLQAERTEALRDGTIESAPEGRQAETLALILRAARELGVIR